MCAKKMFLEFLRTAFSNCMNRNTRSIRGNNCIRLADFVNARHQILLDLEILNNGFADPIRFGNSAEIIFKISKRDQSLQIRRHQIGWAWLSSSDPNLL